MDDQEMSSLGNRTEVIDRKTLGSVDAKKIPPGYGVVLFDPEKLEFLLTNNTGDVRLFINPSTSAMSSMELKEIELDPDTFFSVEPNGLPPQYQEELKKLKGPKKFHVTQSSESSEFVHAIGKGTPKEPLEIVDKSTKVIRKGASLVHLAIIKHVSNTKQPITVLLNKVLFTYAPEGGKVIMDASTTFYPPRKFDDIDMDLKAGKPLSDFDYRYHQYLIENPDIFKDPIDWYREDYYDYDLNMANEMFEKVEERIKKKDF